MLVMKSFCLVDMVIIDGDPNLLPWLEETNDLLQLVSQVLHSQAWKTSSVSMFCTAVGTQCVQYLSNAKRRIIGVFNGSVEGKGQRVTEAMRDKILQAIDTKQAAAQKGSFLDNSSGDVWELRFPKDHHNRDIVTAKKQWTRTFNIGMFAHGSRINPSPVYRPPTQQMQDAVKTKVSRKSERYMHWALDGLVRPNFLAPVSRYWDISISKEHKQFDIIADSQRGPELVEAWGSLLLVMFDVQKEYTETVAIFNNFVQKKTLIVAVDKETTRERYEWMMKAATSEQLSLFYADKFDAYQAPAGKGFLCPSPAERPGAHRRVKAERPEHALAEVAGRPSAFKDEEMEGGENLLSVKELAKWNRARAGQTESQDAPKLGQGALQVMPPTPTPSERARELQEQKHSEERAQTALSNKAPSLPALQSTKYEQPKTAKEAFRLRNTRNQRRRAQSPKRERPTCHYQKHVDKFGLVAGHPIYMEEDYIEVPKRVNREWVQHVHHKCVLEPGVFQYAGKRHALGDKASGMQYMHGPQWGRPPFDDTINKDNIMKFYRMAPGATLRHPPGNRILDTGQWVRRSSTTGLPVDFMASVVMKKPSDPEELNRMTSGSNCYKDHHDPLMRTVPHYAKPGLLREALRTGSPPPPSTKRLSATSMGFYPTRASVPARVEALPSRSNNATPSMSYSVNVSEMALPVVPPLEVSGSR